MDVEDFMLHLSLEMDENVKQDLLKQQKNEEEFINIKNEKIKQEEIKQKQIEEEIKKKVLAIKNTSDNEIKKKIDDTINILKKTMTTNHENEKRKIISDFEINYQKLKNELNNEKTTHSETKRVYYYTPTCPFCGNTYSCYGNCAVIGYCSRGKEYISNGNDSILMEQDL